MIVQARTEAQLGFRLPESYRGFLLAADGWPCFFQDITIFSTTDLLGGDLHKLGRVQLELDECIEATASDGAIAADHFMVAAAQESIDTTLMRRPDAPADRRCSRRPVATTCNGERPPSRLSPTIFPSSGASRLNPRSLSSPERCAPRGPPSPSGSPGRGTSGPGPARRRSTAPRRRGSAGARRTRRTGR